MLRVLIPLTLVALALVPDWAAAFGRRRLVCRPQPVAYAVCPPPVVLPPCLPAFGLAPPVVVGPAPVILAPPAVYAAPQPAVPTPPTTAPSAPAAPPSSPASPPRVEATPAPPSIDPVRPADYPGRAANPAPTTSSSAPSTPLPTPAPAPRDTDADPVFTPAVPKVKLAPQGAPGAAPAAPGSPGTLPPIKVPVGPVSPNLPPTTAQKPSEPELQTNPAGLNLRPAADTPPFALPSARSISRSSPISAKPGFDLYPVRGEAPAPDGEKRPVGFFNLSGREIALTVEGQTVTLPANHQISAKLGASFRWKTDALAEQTSYLAPGDAGADVFIRR